MRLYRRASKYAADESTFLDWSCNGGLLGHLMARAEDHPGRDSPAVNPWRNLDRLGIAPPPILLTAWHLNCRRRSFKQSGTRAKVAYSTSPTLNRAFAASGPARVSIT